MRWQCREGIVVVAAAVVRDTGRCVRAVIAKGGRDGKGLQAMVQRAKDGGLDDGARGRKGRRGGRGRSARDRGTRRGTRREAKEKWREKRRNRAMKSKVKRGACGKCGKRREREELGLLKKGGWIVWRGESQKTKGRRRRRRRFSDTRTLRSVVRVVCSDHLVAERAWNVVSLLLLCLCGTARWAR